MKPPKIPREKVPHHVALVMDGNGRWAKKRGLPRTKGHEQGEKSLFDVVEGALLSWGKFSIPRLVPYCRISESLRHVSSQFT